MHKVFLGVGHGGSDPGAVANNTKEKHACVIEGEEQGSIHAVVDQSREENDCGGGAERWLKSYGTLAFLQR